MKIYLIEQKKKTILDAFDIPQEKENDIENNLKRKLDDMDDLEDVTPITQPNKKRRINNNDIENNSHDDYFGGLLIKFNPEDDTDDVIIDFDDQDKPNNDLDENNMEINEISNEKDLIITDDKETIMKHFSCSVDKEKESNSLVVDFDIDSYKDFIKRKKEKLLNKQRKKEDYNFEFKTKNIERRR